tara:strand:+ start:617 stop:838 length:222 start_codon:yes stop_codon:yes gene_type:complete
MWSNWKEHTQGPAPVGPNVVVIAKLCDGYVLSPMPANQIDWDFVGDAVTHYKVQELKALADLKRIALLELEPA